MATPCVWLTVRKPVQCCASRNAFPQVHTARNFMLVTVARIFTGAQLPPGADAVVMQEQCEALAAEDGQGLGCVVVQASPQPGQWIRRRGEDVQAGSEVLAAGSRLTPQAMGLAASVGCAEVAVLRRPRVALFSTGDELVMPGEISPEQMRPGAIYNSNRYTLRGLLLAAGCEGSHP